MERMGVRGVQMEELYSLDAETLESLKCGLHPTCSPTQLLITCLFLLLHIAMPNSGFLTGLPLQAYIRLDIPVQGMLGADGCEMPLLPCPAALPTVLVCLIAPNDALAVGQGR